MKKAHTAAPQILRIRLALSSGTEAMARSYTTNFPLTENPISEGGNWINAKTAGLEWADLSMMSGLAIGLESRFTGYDDATALLTEIWGSNQTAMASVFTTHRMSGNVDEEVEIRLRSSLSPHSCTGYEVLFSLKPDSSAYVQIVRWNGALGDLTYVAATGGSQFILNAGDTVKTSITNNTITAYINSTPVLQGTDTNYSSGNPGIGIFIQGAGGVNGDYGFTSFTATDGVETPPSPSVAIAGPDTNGSFNMQFSGIPGMTYRIQYSKNIDPPSWQPSGTSTANPTGRSQFTNTPPPDAPQRFYRSVWP